MRLRRADEYLVLELSGTELTALQNGLNEALEALDDWEFPIRVGVDTDAARRILATLRDEKRRVDGGTGSER